MKDETEEVRREMINEINAEPGSREYLETTHDRVYDKSQLLEEFEVLGFMAPVVAVKRRSDGVKGSLTFQHRPRFYFDFKEDK